MNQPRQHHYQPSIQGMQVLAGALLLLAACGPAQLPETDQTQNEYTVISGFVLYAEHSLTLGDGDAVMGGDVGVRTASAPGGSPQLRVGNQAFVHPQHTLLAPSTLLGLRAKVGELKTDALQNNGGLFHSLSPFPATVMPALPLALASPSGSRAVTVDRANETTLEPGSYGALKVEGTLVLKPGIYSFASATLGDGAQLLVQQGGAEVRVQGSFTTGRLVTVSPLPKNPNEKDLPLGDRRDNNGLGYGDLALGQNADASQLMISISGRDGVNAAPVASIGEHSRFTALLAAPHGTVAIGEGVVATGAFAGFDIMVAQDATLVFSKGFAITAPGQQGQQLLNGYFSVQPDPSIAPLVGPVPADTAISLSIGLPVRDPQGLKAFIKQVSDPKNPNFRKFLTQAQFTSTYGASTADYQSLQSWATAYGLAIAATYSNNLLLRVSGTAAQFEQALHANLDYRLRKDGSLFVAVDREPSLDLAVPILRISGLTSYLVPQVAASTGAAGNYRAADLRNAYLGVGSTCQSLDGSGQVVGIIGFAVYQQSDIDSYDALQLPPINSSNVSIAATDTTGTPVPGSFIEATADVELVQAMAPGAQILFFQGSSGITGRLDDALHKMATSNPPLTVMSSSLGFGGGDNAQQAFDQMAAQGVSIFNNSGDFGDVGDPQGSYDLNNQTLVGATILQTANLLAPLPAPRYPNPYYTSEGMWTFGNSARAMDVSGGGIMNGSNLNGNCFCFPYSSCCSGGVPIPDYQVGVSMGTNGGSTRWRNYPDVAMAGANVEIFFQGSTTGFAGTSAAAPLWAGFMALVNQRSLQNGAGLNGFINPTIYAIGQTRGTVNDLYASSFHDIQDGQSNFDSFGPGFNTVPGYDLTTGWGTPTCQLLNQLTSSNPLQPNQPFGLIQFQIDTGDDDLRGNGNNCGTLASANILLEGGGSFFVTLHSAEDIAGFDNNSSHTFTFPVPSVLNPPLTPAHGIAGVVIGIKEHYSPPCTSDNWDIKRLNVQLLAAPGDQQSSSCQLNLVGSSTLQDGSIGLVRLSEINGSSGVGQSATFMTGPGSGCF